MLKIKFTSKSKKPYVRLNNQKFIGFKIAKMPKAFAEAGHKQEITRWFNHKGFTFIAQSDIPVSPFA